MLGRRLRNLNSFILIPSVVLSGFGLLTVYAASRGPGTADIFPRHLVWTALGFIIFLLSVAFDYNRWEGLAYLASGGSLLCLIVVLFHHVPGKVRAWLPLGPIHFQPAEFAKIAFIMALGSE